MENYNEYEEEAKKNAYCDTHGWCEGRRCPYYYEVCNKPETMRDPLN